MSAHRARRRRWNGRWAKNAAIALAPLCALVALLFVGVETRELQPALVAYGVGAVAGLLVGALLGGTTGAVWLALRRRSRSAPRTAAFPTWVLHRPASSTPNGRLVHR